MVFVKHCPVIIFWTKDPAAVGAWAPGAFGANTEMLLPAERIREWSPLDGVPPPEWDGPHVGRRLVEGVQGAHNHEKRKGASPSPARSEHAWPTGVHYARAAHIKFAFCFL
jgi:hypothetical protein